VLSKAFHVRKQVPRGIHREIGIEITCVWSASTTTTLIE
jgi:hypothetical protein